MGLIVLDFICVRLNLRVHNAMKTTLILFKLNQNDVIRVEKSNLGLTKHKVSRLQLFDQLVDFGGYSSFIHYCQFPINAMNTGTTGFEWFSFFAFL